MRVISLNLNGVRSARTKGFYTWLSRQRADFVCLQETKAQEWQLEAPEFHPRRFHCRYHDAEKKGYSGTALYSRHEPHEWIHGIGHPEIDREGRYLEARFGNLSVVSLYLPSGSSGEVRQAFKYVVLDVLYRHLQQLRKQGREIILCGDWNIAHTEADLRNWRGNRKNSGFLPEERQWLDKVFGSGGYRDAFRQIQQPEHEYTWWSNRGAAWEKNVGWRIDYQVCTPALAASLLRTRVYRDKRFSDHAPLIFDYDFEPEV